MDYSGKIIRRTPVTPSQTSASGVWSLDEALQAQKNDSWPIANVPDPISRSLRFRASASAFLSRTPATTSNRKTWTWSGWIKRGTLNSDQVLFSINQTGSDAGTLGFGIDGNNNIYLGFWTFFGIVTTPVYRDPSAWYHIVLAFDTTQATAANRVKLYVNGVEVTAFSTDNRSSITLNGDYAINLNSATSIFRRQFNTDRYTDGYLAELNFIDGQALTPSSFGGTNAVTGVWEPRVYTGTYGTNGFYLPFSNITNTTTLGNDFSGNGNNWTVNNISLTSGSTYDSMLDVPTQWIGYTTGDISTTTRGNYAVMNPLVSPLSGSTYTFSNANLTTLVSVQSAYPAASVPTMSFQTSGKWYCEVTLSAQGAANTWKIGITSNPRSSGSSAFGDVSADYAWQINGNFSPTNPTFYNNGSPLGAYGSTITTNDTLMVAYDVTNGKLWLGKNGTWFNSGDPVAGTNAGLTGLSGEYWLGLSTGGTTNSTNTYQVNFGQRPFAYTPPSGFRSLCTTNLPNPTILQGGQFFNVALWTGTGTTQAVTGLGFQPDFMWGKARSQAYSHLLNDSVRGVGKNLSTDTTSAEDTFNYFNSFDSNGFTVSGSIAINQSGQTFVGWGWKANGAGVTNTAGTITSTVSANTTSGFSIVTWTGNATNNSSVGHGLGVAPAIVIIKNRTDATTWYVKGNPSIIPAFTSQDQYLYLNLTNGIGTSSFNQTTLTSSLIQFPVAGNDTNGSGKAMVAYCFAPVAGYSAFGSYTGNGSSDGPFVYLGFRPRFIMFKRSDSSSNWWMIDTSRSPINQMANVLLADSSGAEFSSGTGWPGIDYLSNGFKLRGTASGINASGGTWIYMAFAENPFKNALAR